MRTKFLSISVVSLLFGTIFFGFIGFVNILSDEAQGATLYVGPGQTYSKIQDAIDNASTDDTIRVYAGTYYENVLVNKSVTLIGNGTSISIIDGTEFGDVVTITVNNVTIQGFSIENSSNEGSGIKLIGNSTSKISGCLIQDNECTENCFGIYLEYSDNNELDNNTADYNLCTDARKMSSGIFLSYSSNNKVINNSAKYNNATGYKSNGYGVNLFSSNYNNITNNYAYGNSGKGGRGWGVGVYLLSSSNNFMINNTANYNDGNGYRGNGISLKYSNNNTLIYNTALHNDLNGFFLCDSTNNTIINNTMKNTRIYDFYIEASSDIFCNNNIINNIGSDDRLIKYFNYSVTYQDDTISELILCNADNSNINNISVFGRSGAWNNGVIILRTENSNLTKINSSDNWEGFLIKDSSNNTISDSNIYINSDDGISLYNCTLNTFQNNIINSNGRYGTSLIRSRNNSFYNNFINNNNNGMNIESSFDNIISNNSLFFNKRGILLENSQNNNLCNNNVSLNTFDGFYIVSSSYNLIMNNTANSNAWHGIYNAFSDFNILFNNTVNLNDWGIYLTKSKQNEIINNIVNSNNYVGINLDYSFDNWIFDNLVQENKKYDIFLWADRPEKCDNTIVNNVGSGDRPIFYVESESDSTIHGIELSELIVCNAEYKVFVDITIAGSDILKNNGVVVLFTNQSTFSHINSSNNYHGFYFYESSENILENNTANNNSRNGIYFDTSRVENPCLDIGAEINPTGYNKSGNIYYVSTSGNNSYNGLTEARAWKTITYAAMQAQAGDVVYIKGGNYGYEQVIINNSGTEDAPIIFQGYNQTPGDNPNPDEMPFLNDSTRLGTAILISEKEYIAIKNIHFTYYKYGIYLEKNSKHITLDNIIGYDIKSIGIYLGNSHYCKLSNCNMTDAWADNFVIKASHYNIIEDCKSYGIFTPNAPDYYFLIANSIGNVVRNCIAHNTHVYDKVHPGHGFSLKDSSFNDIKDEYNKPHGHNNKIIDCKAYCISEQFWVAHGAHHNEFINCSGNNRTWREGRQSGGVAFRIRDGAHNNSFINCRAINTWYGVWMSNTGEGPSYIQFQKNNSFINCIMKDVRAGIFFHYTENNIFKNCVFDHDRSNYYFILKQTKNVGNIITNCIITEFANEIWNYSDKPSAGEPGGINSTYCDYWNNTNFGAPPGIGNIEVDPLFASENDFHLKSQFGRWDGSKWIYDSVTSQCIDLGNPTDDYSDEPNPNGGRINIGAYGNTPEASKNNTTGNYGYVEFTSNYNLVKNNNVTNNKYVGILLQESSNNTIQNNTINKNYCGIYLKKSSGNELKNNSINLNEIGIYLKNSCNENEILNNYINNSMICIIFSQNCNNNLINNNNITLSIQDGYGIYIKNFCNNNNIIDNEIKEYNIYGFIYNSHGILFENKCKNSFINYNLITADIGIELNKNCSYIYIACNYIKNGPIYLPISMKKTDFILNNTYGIFLINNCTDIDIVSNNFNSDNLVNGIRLEQNCSANSIYGNSIPHNDPVNYSIAIHFLNSDNNSIEWNFAGGKYNFTTGIKMYYSYYNIINYNSIANQKYCIWLYNNAYNLLNNNFYYPPYYLTVYTGT